MGEQMNFPDTLDEFIKQYSFIDRKEIYTNGSELIQTFRVKQWEEHRQREYQELNKKLDCERTDCSGRIGNSKRLERLEMENRNLRRAIKKLLNNEDIGTGLMNTLYGYGLFKQQIEELEICK